MNIHVRGREVVGDPTIRGMLSHFVLDGKDCGPEVVTDDFRN